MYNKIVIDAMNNQPNEKRRGFNLCEGSWASSGQYCAATITKLNRTWENMNHTIAMAMSLSMYGFNQISIDSCGTFGNFTEELCARWH